MAMSSMNIEKNAQRKLNTDVINMSTDVNKSASSILAPLQIDHTCPFIKLLHLQPQELARL